MKPVMNIISYQNTRQTIWLTLAIAFGFSTGSAQVSAQVRVKKPDRGVYQPDGSTRYPASSEVRSLGSMESRRGMESVKPTVYDDSEVDDRGRTPDVVEPIRIKPIQANRSSTISGNSNEDERVIRSPTLHEVADPRSVKLESMQFRELDQLPRHHSSSNSHLRDSVRHVSFESPAAIRPTAPTNRTWLPRHDGRHQSMGTETLIQNGHNFPGDRWDDDSSYVVDGSMHGEYFGGCDSCDGGCDSYGCGCDSYGCDGGGHCGNASLSFDPCRWFGSMELLLLWREGDALPPLVTSSPAGTLLGVAGQLPDATVLAGGQNVFDDITAGGRLTIGTWIDSCQSRSLVGRFWTATEEDYSFGQRESINSGNILAIPTTQAAAANAVLVAFPDTVENGGRFGSVNVTATSNVYGADLSVRQFWTGGLGTTYDILYGYQYMRLDEDLSLRTASTITQQQLPLEVGDNLTTSDHFDTQNEFHGGQFGLAGRYREGSWSFDFLAKVGFGQMNRSFERRGRSVITTTDPIPAISETGILVNDVNRGSFTDNTFGWVPELDVSVGWHKYPRFDVTIGYNLIAMTDAIRLSGIMDPVNTTDTPTVGANDATFYLQGIHFGIRHVY